jgi:diaminopimelate epimerase
MTSIEFTKMHGAGNDYIYVDCFKQDVPARLPELARAVSDRHRGIGADGLILIRPSKIADARMQMFNSDGSEAQMCGNGIRCVGKYIFDHGICPQDQLAVETGAGILALDLTVENAKVSRVRVAMGQPRLKPAEIPILMPGERIVDQPMDVGDETVNITCVSMGNPHCIVFVDSLDDYWVLNIGPKIENDPRFPERTNVEFVQVVSKTEVRQRTWERGSGETQACGTGATAVCVAGVLTGRTERKITNHLLGGTLELEWDSSSNQVYKTGPAEEVFSGVWNQ